MSGFEVSRPTKEEVNNLVRFLATDGMMGEVPVWHYLMSVVRELAKWGIPIAPWELAERADWREWAEIILATAQSESKVEIDRQRRRSA